MDAYNALKERHDANHQTEGTVKQNHESTGSSGKASAATKPKENKSKKKRPLDRVDIQQREARANDLIVEAFSQQGAGCWNSSAR